ncbi:hypothetical protein [Draconibacterium mangrovi]|uniref:hypothetical protein n=1 Tax=Draconibacterium mangrovi TaxID=2697469 RepID=UPI0013D690BB|nr:hypothetical protein [Draconibacterium mangrovi]
MKKLEIKKTIITELEIYSSIAAITMLFFKLKKPDFFIVIPFAVICYVGYSIIKRLQNRQPGIIIDKYGIHLKFENKSFPWKSIDDVEVEDINGEKIYFKIKTKNSDFQIDLSHFDTTSHKIKKAIVFFSNGKIKGRETKFFNSIDDLVNDKKNLEMVIDLFKKHKRKVLWVGVLIFFGGIALAIYLQASYPFPFSFAIGWTTILIILFLYYKRTELKLRNSEIIRGLTDRQFNEIAIKFEIRNNADKKNKTFAMIFMVVVTIGIFVVSYLVTS